MGSGQWTIKSGQCFIILPNSFLFVGNFAKLLQAKSEDQNYTKFGLDFAKNFAKSDIENCGHPKPAPRGLFDGAGRTPIIEVYSMYIQYAPGSKW
jgi:hypothetical protein